MSEAKKGSGLAIASMVMTVIAVLACAGAFAAPLLMNAEYRDIYEEMEVALSPFTDLMLTLGSPAVVIPVLILLVTALICNLSAFMLATLFSAMYYIALMMPMRVMVSNVTE